MDVPCTIEVSCNNTLVIWYCINNQEVPGLLLGLSFQEQCAEVGDSLRIEGAHGAVFAAKILGPRDECEISHR